MSILCKSRNLVLFVFSMLLFRILLEVSYVNIVTTIFGYVGYKINFQISNYILSWFLFLLSFVMAKGRITKVSDYFFITALLAVVAPITIVYGYDADRDLLPLLALLGALWLIYIITRIKSVSFKGLPTVKHGQKVVVVLSLVFVVLLVIWYLISGVRFNLDFSKVYEFRRSNAELAARGILAYTNGWTHQVFNVTLLTIALLYKRYFIVAIIFIVQVYFYAASAHKAVLFYPFLVLGIWYYFRKTNSAVVVPFISSCIILVTLLTYYFMDDVMATSLFSRRVFFVPARLTYDYFEFFATNPHVYWSNSILKSLIVYSYDRPVGEVIGQFLGKEDLNANNGFVSMGFAHAGYLGVVFYSALIGFLLRFLDDITYQSLPLWVALSLSVVPLRSFLISTDLFTTMLTHGFIVAIIIIFAVRSKYAYS